METQQAWRGRPVGENSDSIAGGTMGLSLAEDSGGFTLMEICVTMGVILMLVTLSFLSVKGVRESGKRVGCVSNLRQIGMAVQLYATDWGGRIPPSQKWKPEPPYWEYGNGFHGNLNRHYIRGPKGTHPYHWQFEVGSSPSIFRCPADTRPRKFLTTPWNPKYGWNWDYDTSYGLNIEPFNCRNPALPGYPGRGVALVEIPQPEKQLLLAERGRLVPYNPAEITSRADNVNWVTFQHHQGLANVLFVDGHVQGMTKSELTPAIPSDEDTKSPWNRTLAR